MTQPPDSTEEPVALDPAPPVPDQPAEAVATLPPTAEPAPLTLPAVEQHSHTSSTVGTTGVKFVTSVLVIVVFMITFVVQAFRVPSESMENTLLVGDFLLADKVHFAEGSVWSRVLPYRAINRGDIVVFRYPVDPSQYFVKRVVGLPGDRVRLLNKSVYINGQLLHEAYAVHKTGSNVYRDNFPFGETSGPNMNRRWRADMKGYVNGGELLVPRDQYFVMGDNRDTSLDSRYWGFVPRAAIIARPLLIYLSVDGPPEPEGATANDKLLHSGQMLAHFLQLARWDRMFRLVR